MTHHSARADSAPPDHEDATSAVLLLVCAVAALAWANSPWASSYADVLQQKIGISANDRVFAHSLHHWINDGLMTLFFLLVGLEIKREFVEGELASWRRAALPMIAATGGMVVPAAIYILVNHSGEAARGWAIPMATDIAFALGVLALVGRGAPPALKIFLTALAVVDDIGAIAVIGLFYTHGVSVGALGALIVILALLIACNRLGVRLPSVYVVLGVALWFATSRSGVHATLSGVLLATTIPLRAASPAEHSILERWEAGLRGPVAFIVLPLFALANAGVTIGAELLDTLNWGVVAGVGSGLLIGKLVGISGAVWLSTKAGVAHLPAGVQWSGITGLSLIGGIGFTMSLYIASLAFGETPAGDSAKIGIIAGSTVAGLLGWMRLRADRSAARDATHGIAHRSGFDAPPDRDSST
jgi:NhaA family Na+:H+ antiporter